MAVLNTFLVRVLRSQRRTRRFRAGSALTPTNFPRFRGGNSGAWSRTAKYRIELKPVTSKQARRRELKVVTNNLVT